MLHCLLMYNGLLYVHFYQKIPFIFDYNKPAQSSAYSFSTRLGIVGSFRTIGWHANSSAISFSCIGSFVSSAGLQKNLFLCLGLGDNDLLLDIFKNFKICRKWLSWVIPLPLLPPFLLPSIWAKCNTLLTLAPLTLTMKGDRIAVEKSFLINAVSFIPVTVCFVKFPPEPFFWYIFRQFSAPFCIGLGFWHDQK